jgi:hypothetical protein
MNRLATALALTLALVACGGSSGRPDPAIAIVSPTAGASVTLVGTSKSVSLTYTLTNFTTAAPGTCGGVQNCGHIHVLIDGPACTPSGALYNNSSNSSTQATAIFASCPTPTGTHTMELQLHDDVHNPVNNNAGQQVKASVAIVAN